METVRFKMFGPLGLIVALPIACEAIFSIVRNNREVSGFDGMQPTVRTRLWWVYLPPSLHLCACGIIALGYFVRPWQRLIEGSEYLIDPAPENWTT